ncbi:MAG: hypothetical protein ACLFV8_14240 [Alphaproteobacteria bacterium]
MFVTAFRTVAAGTMFTAMIASSCVSAQDMEPRIPEELQVFNFLLGDWKTKVEFFDRNGKIRSVREFSNIVEPIVQGVIYRGRSGPLDKSVRFGETWCFFDRLEKRHRIASVDAEGNFDVFDGQILEDRMIFTNSAKPWPNGKDIIWRRTYYNIKDDSHEVIMEYSFDYGNTWTKANHWVRTRV